MKKLVLNDSQKNTLLKVSLIINAIFILFIVLAVIGILIEIPESTYYQTNDIAEYGVLEGVPQEIAEKCIRSFFPKEISKGFENVIYSHRAEVNELDNYAFETYLEFTIDDETAFQEYVNEITAGLPQMTFGFDESYDDYSYTAAEAPGIDRDHLFLHDKKTEYYYTITNAHINRILVNKEDQRIVFLSLCVDGRSDTGFLTTFFGAFHIDPWQYMQYLSNNK